MKFLTGCAAATLYVWAGAASAGLINPVAIGGREWLQPLSFVDTSWNDVMAVCSALDGSCSGSIGGINLGGWTWASSDDVAGMFNTVYGSEHFGVVSDSLGTPGVGDTAWATAFFDAGFLPTYEGFDEGDYTPFRSLTGMTRTEDALEFYVNYAGVLDALVNGSGYKYDSAYVGEGYIGKDRRYSSTGHYFYRVPAPGTPLLMALALLVLFARRYCRHRSACFHYHTKGCGSPDQLLSRHSGLPDCRLRVVRHAWHDLYQTEMRIGDPPSSV